MRVCDTITVRHGQAYEIKSVSTNGVMLLRPTESVVLKFEKIQGKAVKASAAEETVHETHEITREPHRPSNGTRMGSCAHRGLRKNAQIRHYYDCRLYAFDQYGKTVSWKKSRKTQYRSKEIVQ